MLPVEPCSETRILEIYPRLSQSIILEIYSYERHLCFEKIRNMM